MVDLFLYVISIIETLGFLRVTSGVRAMERPDTMIHKPDLDLEEECPSYGAARQPDR